MTPCSVKVSLKQEESWSAMLDSCGWRTPSPSCSPECRSTGRLQLIRRKTWGVNVIANYFRGRLAALEYIWLVIARVNTWRLRHWTWWTPPPPPPPGPSPRLPLLPLCHHLFCLCQKQLGCVSESWMTSRGKLCYDTYNTHKWGQNNWLKISRTTHILGSRNRSVYLCGIVFKHNKKKILIYQNSLFVVFE